MATLNPQATDNSSSATAIIEETRVTDTGKSSADMATLSDSQTNGNPETVLEDLRVTSDRCDKNKRKKETAKQRKAPAVTKAEEEEELLNKLIAENRAKELERKADLGELDNQTTSRTTSLGVF